MRRTTLNISLKYHQDRLPCKHGYHCRETWLPRQQYSHRKRDFSFKTFDAMTFLLSMKSIKLERKQIFLYLVWFYTIPRITGIVAIVETDSSVDSWINKRKN